MRKDLTFLIVFGLGLAFCVGAIYYIFFYQPAPKDSNLGIIFNPGQEAYARSDALDQIKELEDRNLGIVQVEADWGQLETAPEEYNWIDLDQQLKYFTSRGWRVALVVLPVNGYAIGSWPDDFSFNGFADEEMQQRYYNFLEAVVSRYESDLQYLIIGKDIDKYFSLNQNKLEDYYTFYLFNYFKLKEKYPQLKISTGLSYDYLKTTGNLETMTSTWQQGLDFRSFTYLEASQSQEFKSDLETMLNYRVNDNLALIGTGARVSNNNDVIQEKLVEALLDFNQENRDRIEFINYFSYNDLPLEYCREQAEEQMWYRMLATSTCAQKSPGCDRSMIDSQEKERLAQEMCSFGLKTSEGNNRLGWSAFTQDAGLE